MREATHAEFVELTAKMIPPDLYLVGCEVMSKAVEMMGAEDANAVQTAAGEALRHITGAEDASRDDFMVSAALLMISVGMIDRAEAESADDDAIASEVKTEIDAAIEAITKAHPEAGEHLREYIKYDEATKSFSYDPPPGTPKWDVKS